MNQIGQHLLVRKLISGVREIFHTFRCHLPLPAFIVLVFEPIFWLLGLRKGRLDFKKTSASPGRFWSFGWMKWGI
jgi:hypothetical protein